MSDTKSQSEQILTWLQSGRPLTPLESLERFGCFRLGARIYDLRKRGHEIHAEMVEFRGKRFAKYSMESK